MKARSKSLDFQIKRPLLYFAVLTALSPFCLLIGLHAYVLAARFHLGHWPSYNNPDPKLMGWWLPHVALQLSFSILPLVPLTAICLAIAGRVRARDFPLWRVIAAAILSAGIVFLVLGLDPGGFVNWFWD